MKKLLVLCLALAMLAGCGGPLPSTAPTAEPTAAPTPEVTQEPIADATVAPQPPVAAVPLPAFAPLFVEDELVEESGDGFSFAMHYAVTGREPIDADALAGVEGFLNDETLREEHEGSEPNSATMGYEVVRNDGFYFSILYNTYVYYSGAAHGTTVWQAYNYLVNPELTEEPERLELADLFAPGADYLGELSRVAREKLTNFDVENGENLRAEAGEDIWFWEGIEPTPENFDVFAITEDGLRFVFGDYQVAPYANGPITMDISWNDLAAVMVPEPRAR